MSAVKGNITSTPRKPHRNPDEYSAVLASEPVCTNHFAAFVPKPIGVSFDTQEKDECILLFLRQHPIVNLPWILTALLMIIAPLLLLPIFAPFHTLPWSYQSVIMLAWYVFVFGFVIEKTLMWLFNSFIITDERMIDIDLYSLIFKEVDYARLDKIQDVSVKTSGVWSSLMDIGTVFVQTAGEVPEFAFDNIQHPAKVAKLLNELVMEEQQEEIEGRVR